MGFGLEWLQTVGNSCITQRGNGNAWPGEAMRVRAAPIPKKCHVSIHFIYVTTVSPRPHHLFPGWSFHLKLFSGFLLHKEPKFKFFIVFPIWPCLCRCDAPPHVHDHWSSCPWKCRPDSYLEGFLSAPPQLDLHCPFFNSLLSPQPSLSSERPSLPLSMKLHRRWRSQQRQWG